MSPDLSELLTIDVDAEIRKLCERQLASSEQRIAELIRTAVAHGATEVHLRSPRGFGKGWSLRAPGAVLPGPLLETLQRVRDPARPAAERHRAVVACEREHGPGSLALLATGSLHLRSGGSELRIGPGLASLRRVTATAGDLVVILPERLDAPTVRRLARDCRFAPVPVWIADARVSRGLTLPEALLAVTVAVPVESGPDAAGVDARAGYVAVVGLPRDDELCRTIVVDRGVVVRETAGVSPSGFAHVAVLTREAVAPCDRSAAEALAPVVREARAGLYRRLSSRWAELPPGDRRAAKNLVLRRCAAARDLRPLAGLPLFARLRGLPMDIDALRAAAADRVLWAVEPGARPRAWIAEAHTIFVLDERERGFLAEHCGLVVAEPPVRAPDGRLHRLRQRLRRGAASLAARIRARIAAAGARRPVPDDALDPAERTLVEAVRSELRAGRCRLPDLPLELSRRAGVAMVARGRLPGRVASVAGHRTLLLPRGDPDVRRAAAAVVADPRNVYPALIALLAGHDGYGENKRALHAAMLSGPRSVESGAHRAGLANTRGLR